jgi:YD repeat-containing protein
MRKLMGLVALAGGAVCIATAATTAPLGNEATNYSYDAHGRLMGSTTAGGPNNTRTTGTCFDRAGNRMRYDVNTSASATCPTPSPTP